MWNIANYLISLNAIYLTSIIIFMADKYSFKQSSDTGRLDGELRRPYSRAMSGTNRNTMFSRITAASVTPFGERQKRRIVFVALVVVVGFVTRRIGRVFASGSMKMAVMADSLSYVHLATQRKLCSRTRCKSARATTL